MSREERALRRKQQHQVLDVKRRQREATALQRLHELTQLSLVPDRPCAADDCGSPAAAEVTVAVAIAEGSRRRTRPPGASAEGERPAKVAVLEEAVHRMERLVQLLNDPSVAGQLKDRHLRAMQQQLQLIRASSTSLSTSTHSTPTPPGTAQPPPLPSLFPSTFSFLSRWDCSAVLSSFIRPLVSLLLVSMPEYVVVDVNAQHQLDTGWEAASIINKLLAWSLSKDDEKADVSPLVKKAEREGSDGALRLKRVHQYPGSGRLLRELLSGSRQKADIRWRFYRPGGQLWETPCTCWLAAKDASSRSDDGQDHCCLPGYVIIAAASQDAIRVDD